MLRLSLLDWDRHLRRFKSQTASFICRSFGECVCSWFTWKGGQHWGCRFCTLVDESRNAIPQGESLLNISVVFLFTRIPGLQSSWTLRTCRCCRSLIVLQLWQSRALDARRGLFGPPIFNTESDWIFCTLATVPGWWNGGCPVRALHITIPKQLPDKTL